MNKISEKIFGFMKLGKWEWYNGYHHNYYQGIINTAHHLNEKAIVYNFETNAFYGEDGIVRVSLYKRNHHLDTVIHYLEFTVEGPNTIDYLYEYNDEENKFKLFFSRIEEKENISLLEAIKIIVEWHPKHFEG